MSFVNLSISICDNLGLFTPLDFFSPFVCMLISAVGRPQKTTPACKIWCGFHGTPPSHPSLLLLRFLGLLGSLYLTVLMTVGFVPGRRGRKRKKEQRMQRISSVSNME